MTRPETPRPELTRRAFGCAALFGITGPLLVACSSDEDPDASPSPEGSASTSPSESGGGGGAMTLVAAADVPVGGGVVIADQGIVVTQPAEGDFKGYSSVCTHEGNPVGSVSENTITCNFHGSQFSTEDGSVVNGPATSPLPEIAVKVVQGKVVRA